MDRFIDPAALMRVKSLELRTKMVMEGFWKGLHRSPFHGFSVEFSEYRPYVSGDDTRYLDWKVMARTDRTYLKKFEDETNLRAHILVDASQSMSYGSAGYSKADYAATLAATLAFFLLKQNDAVGVTTFDQRVVRHLPARQRPGHLRRLMSILEQGCPGTGSDLAASLKDALELIRKRSLVVALSDFLAPLDEVERRIGHFAAGGHEMMVWQILDPREIHFDFSQDVRLLDAETGRESYVHPEMVRSSYQEKLQAHQERLRGLCHRHGVGYRLVSTAEPLEQVLFEFVSRGRKKP